MRNAMLMIATLLPACATAAPPAEAEIPVRGSTSGYVCRSADQSRFAGREATSELAAEMLRATGARVIRWVQPGMMVTMDYSESRLTVRLDGRNRVISATCG